MSPGGLSPLERVSAPCQSPRSLPSQVPGRHSRAPSLSLRLPGTQPPPPPTPQYLHIGASTLGIQIPFPAYQMPAGGWPPSLFGSPSIRSNPDTQFPPLPLRATVSLPKPLTSPTLHLPFPGLTAASASKGFMTEELGVAHARMEGLPPCWAEPPGIAAASPHFPPPLFHHLGS